METPERPRVVVCNQVSVEGRVVGFDTHPDRYHRLGFRWPCDAILMGSTTALVVGPTETEEDQQRTLPPRPRLRREPRRRDRRPARPRRLERPGRPAARHAAHAGPPGGIRLRVGDVERFDDGALLLRYATATDRAPTG
ncbi:hypothetical protein AB4Z14_05450 [Terrabacter sp. 2TAF16]|uniref:hypothetical protein n=1 Tax=Terrabacter sp. 2TAF16 TaxID=3233008 RepID=UPI003F9CBA99